MDKTLRANSMPTMILQFNSLYEGSTQTMDDHFPNSIISMPEENPKLQGGTLTGAAGTGKSSLLEWLSITHFNQQEVSLDLPIPFVVIASQVMLNLRDIVSAQLSILGDHRSSDHQTPLSAEYLMVFYTEHVTRYTLLDEIHYLKTNTTSLDDDSF